MSTILDRIVESKRQEVAIARVQKPLLTLQSAVKDLAPCRDFFAAVTRPGEVNVIAEVKKASPSVGLIRPDFDPVAIAMAYAAGGAACLSVLTDGPFFQGRLDDLIVVKKSVSIPILRKEFVIDPYQIWEARAAGADAILLIAEILPGEMMTEFHALAVDLGLTVLVEFHDAVQLPRVLKSGVRLVGINNRDLRTFETRLSHTIQLMKEIPESIAVVGESGIKTHADMKLLGDAGVKAVLVGESLMRENDVGKALLRLRGKE